MSEGLAGLIDYFLFLFIYLLLLLFFFFNSVCTWLQGREPSSMRTSVKQAKPHQVYNLV